MHNYERLIVWKKAMQLAQHTYRLVKDLPPDERYGLSDQLRRAAISIPSNIAEGSGRGSPKEFRQFLSIALGSVSELETQLRLTQDLRLVTHGCSETMGLAEEVRKMLRQLVMNMRTS